MDRQSAILPKSYRRLRKVARPQIDRRVSIYSAELDFAGAPRTMQPKLLIFYELRWARFANGRAAKWVGARFPGAWVLVNKSVALRKANGTT